MGKSRRITRACFINIGWRPAAICTVLGDDLSERGGPVTIIWTIPSPSPWVVPRRNHRAMKILRLFPIAWASLVATSRVIFGATVLGEINGGEFSRSCAHMLFVVTSVSLRRRLGNPMTIHLCVPIRIVKRVSSRVLLMSPGFAHSGSSVIWASRRGLRASLVVCPLMPLLRTPLRRPLRPTIRQAHRGSFCL